MGTALDITKNFSTTFFVDTDNSRQDGTILNFAAPAF